MVLAVLIAAAAAAACHEQHKMARIIFPKPKVARTYAHVAHIHDHLSIYLVYIYVHTLVVFFIYCFVYNIFGVFGDGVQESYSIMQIFRTRQKKMCAQETRAAQIPPENKNKNRGLLTTCPVGPSKGRAVRFCGRGSTS